MAEQGDQKAQEPEYFRSPLGVTADEEGEDKVRVCVVIPGLKSKVLNSKPDYVTVKIGSSSLVVLVDLKTKDKNGKEKMEKYRYQVKKLPGEVMTDDENIKDWKVDNVRGKVEVYLTKVEHRSWRREMQRQCFRVVDDSSDEDSSSTSNDS